MSTEDSSPNAKCAAYLKMAAALEAASPEVSASIFAFRDTVTLREFNENLLFACRDVVRTAAADIETKLASQYADLQRNKEIIAEATKNINYAVGEVVRFQKLESSLKDLLKGG